MNIMKSIETETELSKGNVILTEKPAKFTVSLGKYNQIVGKLLEVSGQDHFELMEHIENIKNIHPGINKIISESGYSIQEILERHNVKKRAIEKKEKELEEKKLLTYAKLEFGDNYSEKVALEQIKKILEKQFQKIKIVTWSDGSINYMKSLKELRYREKIQREIDEAKRELNQGREEKGRLKLAQKRKINIAFYVDKALELKEKLSHSGGMTYKGFLSGYFNENQVIKILDSFIKMYEKKYQQKLCYDISDDISVKKKQKEQEVLGDKELYPNDRKDVILTYVFSPGKNEICKVRGEKEIIGIVRRFLGETGVDFSQIVTKKQKKEFKEKMQSLIDLYYEVLRKIQILSYSDKGIRKWEKLDLENINIRIKINNRKFQKLNTRELQKFLKKRVDSLYEKNAKFNPRTALDSEDNQPIDFDGFYSFLISYHRLKKFSKKKISEKQMWIKSLENLGFYYTNNARPIESGQVNIKETIQEIIEREKPVKTSYSLEEKIKRGQKRK